MTNIKFNFHSSVQEDSLIIPFSKSKIWQLIGSTFLLILICIWIIIYSPECDHWLFRYTVALNIIAIISLLLLTMLFLAIIRQLLWQKPAIIINRHGIIDHSSYLSNGLIKWSSIQGFKVSNDRKPKMVVILIDKPNDYIQKTPQWLKRQLLKLNFQKYGSPICISTVGLKTNTNALCENFLNKKKAYNYNQLGSSAVPHMTAISVS